MENLANRVLLEHWDGALPVDPIKIAKSLKVSVQVDHEGVHPDKSGYFTRIDGLPTIFVNPNEIIERQRFTIAHELGHCVNGDSDVARQTTQGFYDPVERRANEFAAALLMPEKVVKVVLGALDKKTVESLARVFMVSEQAMKFRLINLGMLGDS